ncbi:hypothetical protein AnigIFM60653_009908 [Aspergillus niger]|nr:hypothetical protein AnigIFM50267_006731 [Aspergillus niger]GLA08377.1 hypothetical protein AnigIFM60653_009908 [Aspergillus niger]
MAPSLTLHRVTTLEELKSLSYIGADAFRDDAGMSWFFPGGRDHPEDFVVAWKYLLLQDYLDRGKFILAAKVRDTDEGADGADGADRHPGRIVGFAVWERTGVCDAAKSWQGSSFSKKLKRIFLDVKIAYTFFLDTPRRSISWSNLKYFGRELVAAKASQPAETWYLSVLAVRTTAQGQGVGKKLLQWGIDRSEEEGIPSTLVATDAGFPLYGSRGFKRTGWLFFDNGKQKQTIMRRDTRYT